MSNLKSKVHSFIYNTHVLLVSILKTVDLHCLFIKVSINKSASLKQVVNKRTTDRLLC